MKYIFFVCLTVMLTACSEKRKEIAHYKKGCLDVIVYEGNDTVVENNCDDSEELYVDPGKGTVTPVPVTPGSGRPNVPF